MTPEPGRDEQPLPVTTPPSAQKPKGIRRTLGRKVEETAESTRATETSSTAIRPSPGNPSGIKRTLGSRTAQRSGHDGTVSPSPTATLAQDKDNVQSAHMEQDKAPKEPPDDDEAANEKRAALKRQFAAVSHKSKKRKF
jgi:hypothetical protein